jgi:hypothetical protein
MAEDKKRIAEILRGLRIDAEELRSISDHLSQAYCLGNNIADDVTAVLLDYEERMER